MMFKMPKKICFFYALAFFFVFCLLGVIFTFGIKIKPLDSFVFIFLLGLLFSFPVVVILPLLRGKKKFLDFWKSFDFGKNQDLISLYAFGFFVTFSLFLTSIVFKIKIKPLSDLVFVTFIGLVFSFPVIVFLGFLGKFKPLFKKKKNLSYPEIFLIFLAGALLVGLMAPVRKNWLVQKKPTPTPVLKKPLPTPTPRPGEGKLPFKDLSFELDGSLLFVRFSSLDEDKDLLLTVLADESAEIFVFVYDKKERRWRNESHRSPDEFLFIPHGPLILDRPGLFWFEYQSFNDSFIDLATKRENGYETDCFLVDEEKRVCLEKRSVYFAPLKNRDYPWDGRFYYHYLLSNTQEQILTFDYADLEIIWDDPNHYCADDCFSTKPLGIFDQGRKVLLALVGESRSRWCGDDDSCWFGFYVVDLKTKKLTPLKLSDFDSSKGRQEDPYLLFSDLNLLVYYQDFDQLGVYNLLTGQKRFLKIQKEKPEDEWYLVDLKKFRDRYLYFKGDWAWTEYFEKYFDLIRFRELEASETPTYVKNPGGFWNQNQTQYAWEEGGIVFVYDEAFQKTEILLDREINHFSQSFHLAGWGN
jgi:hypothetical protein